MKKTYSERAFGKVKFVDCPGNGWFQIGILLFDFSDFKLFFAMSLDLEDNA